MNDTWPEKVAELPDDEATQPAEDEDEAAAPVDDEAAQPVEDETAAPPLEPLIRTPDEHTAGGLDVPDGYAVLEGSPDGAHRGVAVVVARFNGEISSSLLASALDELERAGVLREAITVVPVPGAFELPLAAMAFAKTRRYACVVALGCVIRGETPHFDFVAGEAASGLQLAALETGVPVAFGVLTTETVEQAEKRTDKGAEAARCALEMADLFAQLRIAAASV